MPDLNWENPEVREAVYSMMRWWLDRGVDGFRMDVINMLSKDPDKPEDGWISGPRIHEFLQEMHREVFAGREETILTVGEMPDVTLEDAQLFTDPARRELDMVFQFEHVGLDQGELKWDVRGLQLTDLKRSFGRWQEGLAETGWNSLYWNNHDQPRIVSRFGDDSPEHRVRAAKMLGTILHLHRGTPYVYQGEELGMTNTRFDSIEAFRDIESLNHYAEVVEAGADPDEVLAALRTMSRDNARTPMQWDASPHAGFTSGEPWIPVNANHAEINAEAAVADPDSVFHHYRRLIELRHTEPVVAHGDFTMLLPDDERVYAFTRRLGDDELLVLGNFSGEDAPVALDDPGGELVLGNYEDAGEDRVLRPWEARSPARLRAMAMIDTPHGPARRDLHAPDGERAGGARARPRRRRRLQGARPAGGHRGRARPGRLSRRARRAALPRRRPALGRADPPARRRLARRRRAPAGGELRGLPLVAGGRSRRARASPAGPPRRPAPPPCCASPSRSTRRASRRRAGSTSSTASRSRCSSSRASATRSACRPSAPGREVVVVPGTHSFSAAGLAALTEAARPPPPPRLGPNAAASRSARGGCRRVPACARADRRRRAPARCRAMLRLPLPPPRARARRALPGRRPAAASADSLVYIKAGNVWLGPAGRPNAYQVTTDGTPPLALPLALPGDDGTIAVSRYDESSA